MISGQFGGAPSAISPDYLQALEKEMASLKAELEVCPMSSRISSFSSYLPCVSEYEMAVQILQQESSLRRQEREKFGEEQARASAILSEKQALEEKLMELSRKPASITLSYFEY